MSGLSSMFDVGSVGQGVDASGAGYTTKQTSPPEHYTEGTLLQDMKSAAKFIKDPVLKEELKEAGGIGTPATIPNIMESLKDTGHVEVKGRKIISTELGRKLNDITPEDLKDPGKTAIWEAYLKKIAAGTGSMDHFLSNQISFIKEEFVRIKSSNLAQDLRSASDKKAESRPCASIGCMDGGNIRLIKGQHGNFWGCDKKSVGCANKIRMEKNKEPYLYDPTDDIERAKIDGEGTVCPKCNKGRLAARTVMKRESSMFGKQFLVCENSKCDYRKWPESANNGRDGGGEGRNASGADRPKFEPLVGEGDPCQGCGNGVLRTNIVSNTASKAYGKRFLSCSLRCGAKSIFEDQIPSGAKSIGAPLKADHTKEWRLPGEGKPCPRCSSDLVTLRVSADHRTSANKRFLQCSNPICNHVIWENQAMKLF